MKTSLKLFLGAIILIVVSVVVILGVVKSRSSNSFLGSSYSAGGSNIISSVVSSATSTSTGLPVLLLVRNATRQYCYIVNDSDTAVYITFKNFTSATAASTTVGAANGGLRLNANGGSFECLPEKMVVSDIWASSTASGKQIISGQQ